MSSPAPVRQYGREDVDYETWYSPWMKQLARTKTRDELLRALEGAERAAADGARAHLRAVEATTSMGSQSQRRAQSRNTMAGAKDRAIAISGALEIHDLFPEHAKET